MVSGESKTLPFLQELGHVLCIAASIGCLCQFQYLLIQTAIQGTAGFPSPIALRERCGTLLVS